MTQQERTPPARLRSLLPFTSDATWTRAAERENPAVLEHWRWMTFPILLFLGTRFALLAFSHIGLTLIPTLFWEHGPREFLRDYPAIDGLCRWDCWWFDRIAQHGYVNQIEVNFFPLFPLLTRWLFTLTGMHPHLALLVVANLASLGAYIVIYRVFVMMSDVDSARSALVLFAAYPFAFFQATAYPESLMLFFGALAILLALRGNHIWAGVALGIGVLARHLTMFMGAALLVAQIRQRGFHPRRLLLSPAILGLIIPWLFLAGYGYFQYRAFGDPMAFAAARTQPPWSDMAWWGIGELLTTTIQNEHVRAMYSYIPFALVVTVGAFALGLRWEWLELAAFSVIFIAVLWSIGMWGLGRYSASVWPAFLPMGVWLAKRHHLRAPVVGLFAIFQGLFFFLFSHQFAIL
jgi:hypothetical protein